MLTEHVPALENADELWADAERELRFWTEHQASLASQYPDQFVAVQPTTGEVIAARTDLAALVDALRAQQLEPTQVWMRFLSTTPDRVIL